MQSELKRHRIKIPALFVATLWSGTIASLVMMPAGFLFKTLGLRVGHYGPQLGRILFGDPSPLLLFIQHLVIGWLSAVPLLIFLVKIRLPIRPWITGALYGAAYYVAVNSLLLPLAFGDPTPWQLGFAFIYPSLVVHLIFGTAVGLAAGPYLRAHH